MYKPSRHQILLNDPGVTVTLSDDEEVKLMPMNPHDRPNKGKSLLRLVKILETSSEAKDWNNLPPFLEGMVMAKQELSEGWLQKIVRKASESGRSGVIIRCAEMVKKTDVIFSDPCVTTEMMLGCHIRAAKASWMGEEAEKAMKQADQVALMMEAKEHCGGKLKEGQMDMRRSTVVIGVLLELAAARALQTTAVNNIDRKAIERKVMRLVEDAVVLCRQNTFQPAVDHLAAATMLEKWLPMLGGFKMAQKIAGIKQMTMASDLRERAQKLQEFIDEAKLLVEEQAQGKPRRCLNMYNEVASL